MSVVALPMAETGERTCGRSGGCCEFVSVKESPRKWRYFLRHTADSSYGLLTHGKVSLPKSKRCPQLAALFKALGTCRGFLPHFDEHGKAKKRSYGDYIYGPCANLSYDEAGLACCSLHATGRKHYLCAFYPVYPRSGRQTPNPGYMKGCGYNEDPNAGIDAEHILSNIKPLWKKEM